MKKGITFTTVGLILTTALAFAWNVWGPTKAPAGQPELRHLDTSAYTQFKSSFNRAAHTVRVVALLSPT